MYEHLVDKMCIQNKSTVVKPKNNIYQNQLFKIIYILLQDD